MNTESATQNSPATFRFSYREAWLLVIVVLLAANLFAFVRQNAVAVPYFDQWDLHDPIWFGESSWSLFTYQHGPHRQGIFFPPTAFVLSATHGDIRVEALWTAGWLLVAAALTLWLLRRRSGRWQILDALPVAACLSLLQNETITTTPNLSHSIGPLVLVLLAAHAFYIEHPWRRWMTLAVLGVLLTFTGFGLFAAILLTLWAIGRTIRPLPTEDKRPARVAALMLVLGWLVFLSDYQFAPASPGFAFPHYPLFDYARFLAGLLATPFGFTAPTAGALAVGALLLVAAVGILFVIARRLWQSGGTAPADLAAGLLVATGLLFALNTTIGRVHLGPEFALTSRYVSLLLPLPLALYWLVRDAQPSFLRGAGLVLLAGLTLWPYRDLTSGSGRLGTWGLPQAALANTGVVRNDKLAWLSAFALTSNVEKANALARAVVYPAPGAPLLADKIAQLQALHWAPFRDGATPTDYAPLAGPPPVVLVGFHGEDEGMHWLAREGTLQVHGKPGQWLNVELRDRFAGLPPAAPLVFEFQGRRGTLPSVHPGDRLSLPLAGNPDGVVQWSSPAGAVRPSDFSNSSDRRELSFRFGRLTVDDQPLFSIWTQKGVEEWAPARAILERHGFHGWEKGFGWMDAKLELVIATTGDAWLNIRVGGRFPGLPGTGGLLVSVDSGSETPVPLTKNKGAFSVRVPGSGRHVVALRSADGAISPRAAGQGQDTRELSYSIIKMETSAAALFDVLPAPPAPAAKP